MWIKRKKPVWSRQNADWKRRIRQDAACRICGFQEKTGIHLPAISGPNKGLPWGHAYQAKGDLLAAQDAPAKTGSGNG